MERVQRQGLQVQIGIDDAPTHLHVFLPEVGTHVVLDFIKKAY